MVYFQGAVYLGKAEIATQNIYARIMFSPYCCYLFENGFRCSFRCCFRKNIIAFLLPRQLAMSVIIKESDARKDNSWKRPLRLRRNEHPRQALYIRNLTLRKMFQPFSVLSFYADFHRKIG